MITVRPQEGTHVNRLASGALGSRDMTKYFISHKVSNRWNLLDQRTVNDLSINAFKPRLMSIEDNQMGFFIHKSTEP